MGDNRWYDPDPTLRKRGRKSAASVTVLPTARTQPPQPPARFTAAEKAVWRETIESVRPGWFAGSEGVARHVLHIHRSGAPLCRMAQASRPDGSSKSMTPPTPAIATR
jgi:hypothetical protein